MSLERTLTIIKPDGVEQGNVGDIIQIFEKNQFSIKAAKMLHLTGTAAGGFYAVHRERSFYNDLVRYMSSGPVLVLVLEAENAVGRLRDLMGATDPKKAAEGTIRKRFATSIEKNVIHGSDSVENAESRSAISSTRWSWFEVPLKRGNIFIERGAAARHEKLPGKQESALHILLFRFAREPASCFPHSVDSSSYSALFSWPLDSG